MTEWTFLSESEESTRRLGCAIGQSAARRQVIGLRGRFGAGKTRLIQGICQGLEVTGQVVNSPTFALIHEYQGRIPVYHFDTYRLRSVEEFLELGAEEYLNGSGICLIEWADRVTEVLPDDRLEIALEVAGPTARELTFRATGPLSSALLKQVPQTLALG